MHRGVYAVGHARLSRQGRWLAAVLAHGPGALLSHQSAGALWGLAPERGPVDVTAQSGRRGRKGIRLHRALFLPEERTARAAIPVTSVARTLVDLAETLDPDRLSRAYEEADRLRLLVTAEIERVCERSHGRRGLRPILALLAESAHAETTRSPLEDRVLSLCREHGLSTPRTNVEILGHEVDAYWPNARLVVEADSFEFHRHRAAFERDRARDAAMQADGYRVVRLTHRRLEREPEDVAAELRRLLGLN